MPGRVAISFDFPFHPVTEIKKMAIEAQNIEINVNGGGLTGQAGAIRLGISRALIDVNSEYRSVLKEKGYLTRDARKVERKKPGQPGARKNFQFSKR